MSAAKYLSGKDITHPDHLSDCTPHVITMAGLPSPAPSGDHSPLSTLAPAQSEESSRPRHTGVMSASAPGDPGTHDSVTGLYIGDCGVFINCANRYRKDRKLNDKKNYLRGNLSCRVTVNGWEEVSGEVII